MRKILIAVTKVEHWNALVPVLPWLDSAGVRILAHFRGGLPPRGSLRRIAQKAGVRLPPIRWTRRKHARDGSLLIGTTDDMELLHHLGARRPFLAVPRLPFPAVALGPRVKNSLARAAEQSQRCPAGCLLNASLGGPLAALSAKTRDLRYLMTGFPQLDRLVSGPPNRALTIMHAWDLTARRPSERQDLLEQARALESILIPLAGAVPIEVRSRDENLTKQDLEILHQVLDWIRERRSLGAGRIQAALENGWAGLARARAVIVLTPEMLLAGLVAGVERIWWLPFALGDEARGGDRHFAEKPRFESCRIASKEMFSRWVAERGWEEPPQAPHEIVEALGPILDRHASERTAQTILAAIEDG